MYSMPASARWSSVSKVCVRPGPNQPRGLVPENFSITDMVRAMTARWSSTLCMGICS